MFLTAKNFGLQEETTSPTRKEITLIKKTGWGTTGREREGRESEREGEREVER